MGLARYLAAILDLCKLGGFPTGVEFQQIDTCYNTPLLTYWRRNCFGNNLVHRLVKNHLKYPYYFPDTVETIASLDIIFAAICCHKTSTFKTFLSPHPSPPNRHTHT